MAGTKKTKITEWTNGANRAYKELAAMSPKQRKMALTLVSTMLEELAEEEAAARAPVPADAGFDANGSESILG